MLHSYQKSLKNFRNQLATIEPGHRALVTDYADSISSSESNHSVPSLRVPSLNDSFFDFGSELELSSNEELNRMDTEPNGWVM